MKKITLSILLLMVSTISNLNSSDQRGNERVDKALSELQRRLEKVESAQDGISLGQRAKNSMMNAGFNLVSGLVLSRLAAKLADKIAAAQIASPSGQVADTALPSQSAISKAGTWVKENPTKFALGAGGVAVGSVLAKQALNKVKDMRKPKAQQINFEKLQSHDFERFVRNN